jgi:ADP-heptose:LPS heptosyltransferase
MIKTSHIKRQLSSKIINLIFNNKKNTVKKYNSDKILIIATDALGDVIVKTKLYDLIIEKYGKENVVFMFNYKWASAMEKLGYKIFHSKTKKEKYGLISRIKLIKKINNEKFDKIINLEGMAPELPIEYLKANEKIGFIKKGTENNFDKFLYGDDYFIILEKLKDMAGLILERKISSEEIKPDIRFKVEKIQEEEGIIVGIGASFEKKMCTPLKMIEILREITEKFPKEKIYLLGVGKKQDNYATEIIRELPSKKIVNLVDKLTVFESLEKINNSKFFLGFDSGLYNIAFALKKKIIVIFDNLGGFQHQDDNIQIIVVDKDRKHKKQSNMIYVENYDTEYKDDYYGSFKFNNFDTEYIQNGLKKLTLIKG